jgi:hypothetical protein
MAVGEGRRHALPAKHARSAARLGPAGAGPRAAARSSEVRWKDERLHPMNVQLPRCANADTLPRRPAGLGGCVADALDVASPRVPS